MLDFIYAALDGFRKVFSRELPWLIFAMLVLGFIGSSEMIGVTSFCRFWLLESAGYDALLHFFRSRAWSLPVLLERRQVFVISRNRSVVSQGRAVLLGDHTNISKEGGRMPGVLSLRQTSETQSKPSYFRGQCWAGIGLVVGSLATPFCLPLSLRLDLAFVHIDETLRDKDDTMTGRMVRTAKEIALLTNTPSVLILDAYFSVGAVFREVQSLWSVDVKAPLVEVITRAKKNYTAYMVVPPNDRPKVGRPRKYGDKVYLMAIFDHPQFFQTVKARVYGKCETIRVCTWDFLWKPVGGIVRFVFAETSRGRIVLMCSNLEQDPVAAVELYCVRIRIEGMFDMLKNLVRAFQFHFWTGKLPKHSRTPKSNKQIKTPNPKDLEIVRAAWEACERFVNIGAIAMGLLQLIALEFPTRVWGRFNLYLRTKSRDIPSERTVKTVLASLIVQDIRNPAQQATMRKIQDFVRMTLDRETSRQNEARPIQKARLTAWKLPFRYFWGYRTMPKTT